MNRLIVAFIAVAASGLGIGTAMASPPAPFLRPSPRLEQSYQLGISIYQPTAAVIAFDHTIKSAHLSVAQMAAQSDTVRAQELAGYKTTIALLKKLGAPATVVGVYSNALSILLAPLVISDNAKTQVPDDPAAQKVISTLDEADAAAPNDGGATAAWLKLSHGRDALWSYHLGNLVSVIDAQISGKPSDLPLVAEAGALEQDAPSTTPQPLLDALQTVADQQKRHRLTTYELQQLETAAENLFGSPQAQPGR